MVSPSLDIVLRGGFSPLQLPGLKLWLDAGSGVVTSIASFSMTGTVAQTGVTLTGVGTKFTSEATIGDNISGGGVNGNVTAIASDTSLTLDSSATVGAGDTVTLTPVAGVTDRVSQWSDLSGTANHLGQATQSKQPDLKPGILNGNKSLRGDGVDDYVVIASPVGLPSGGASLTMVILFIPRTAQAANATILGYGVVATRQYPRILIPGNNDIVRFGTQGDDQDLTLVSTRVNMNLLAIWRYDSTSLKLYANLPVQNLSASKTLGGTPNWSAVSLTALASVSPDTYSNVDILEAQLYASYISDSNINKLIRYYSRKYNIAVTYL